MEKKVLFKIEWERIGGDVIRSPVVDGREVNLDACRIAEIANEVYDLLAKCWEWLPDGDYPKESTKIKAILSNPDAIKEPPF